VGSRFLVTGVQLGMIKGFTIVNQPQEINQLIEEIIDKQYVGHSNEQIEKDVEVINQVPYVIGVATRFARDIFDLLTKRK